MAPIRVLIVDDSFTIRAMLEEVLGRSKSVQLVGSAADADTAVHMVRTLYPEVVTIDVEMPGRDGISLLDEIRGLTHPIMLSSHVEAQKQSREHGALGFFDKGLILKDPAKLIAMIERAADGGKTRARRSAGSGHVRADGAESSGLTSAPP